ncbi:hypothetical protein SAMN04487914_12355 [Arthrobacter sp. ok909]|nr:hypothetical protein SAMN04487914_12355 [Arthrobacter sp. ok909]
MVVASYWRITYDGKNFPGVTFTSVATGLTLHSEQKPGDPRNLFYVEVGYFQDVLVAARGYSSQIVNSEGQEHDAVGGIPVEVSLHHLWPYEIFYNELPLLGSPPTRPLDDGDIIYRTRDLGQVPQNVVAIHIHSDLHWFKRINVPDGEGSSWNIWTGAAWPWGARRFDDEVALWAHQANNGQHLTFLKAKTLGLMSETYTMKVDPSWLVPGCRVTFTWEADSAPGV